MREAIRRADRRLSDAIDDFFLAETARLGERTRLAVARALEGTVGAIEADVRRHAARTLAGFGADARAETLLADQGSVADRLGQAGLLRDRGLMAELIARAETQAIAAALPPSDGEGDAPSLLVRLAEDADPALAGPARALMAAETRRRTANDEAGGTADALPATLHAPLVWLVAAAIREASVAANGDDSAVDRAIVDAAQRCLAAHEDGARVEALATRLALAIDARPEELGPLLLGALGDRRLTVFVALLARAVGLDHEAARAVVVDPAGDRLWVALRAAMLDRATIARIGLSLADADPRRDVDAFADQIDTIAALPVETARARLAPLTLRTDLRQAIDALDRATPR